MVSHKHWLYFVGMVLLRAQFRLFFPTLRRRMVTLLAMGTLSCVGLDCILATAQFATNDLTFNTFIDSVVAGYLRHCPGQQ